MVAAQGVELKERVEGHELNTRLLIHLFARHTFKQRLHRSFRMRVTVAIGLAKQSAVLAEHREVAPPRVDADGGNLCTLLSHQRQGLQDFAIECQEVPVPMTTGMDDRVRESRQFALFKTSVRQCAQDGSSACRTEVNCKEIHR